MSYRYYAVPRNYCAGAAGFSADYGPYGLTLAILSVKQRMVGQGHVDNTSLVGRHWFQSKWNAFGLNIFRHAGAPAPEGLRIGAVCTFGINDDGAAQVSVLRRQSILKYICNEDRV